ncbi:MAG: ABC transporter permease [Candidatus Solibacter usitatus]|nr:ABC transporter permease [Candidatus Solibacter usitatus]
MTRWIRRLRALFAASQLDREFETELAAHLDLLAADFERLGMSPHEARRQARLKLGGAAQLQEMHREERGFPQLETLARDLLYALRGLRRSPGFTLVAVLCLALGIGANTAVFSLLDQVLYRLLPVKDPQQLVWLNARGPSFGNPQGSALHSYPMYKEIRGHGAVFSGVLARWLMSSQAGFAGRAERVWVEVITGNYFQTLGVGAHLGRVITPEDDVTPGGHPVAVLSYNYWRTRFDSDRSVIGKTIVLNGHSYTLIGVSEASYQGLDLHLQPEVRVPVMMKAEMTAAGDDSFSAARAAAPSDLDNRRARWLKPSSRCTRASWTGSRESPSFATPARIDPAIPPGPARASARLAGRPRQPGAGASRLAGPAGRSGRGAAHRLRQYRQPAAGARRGASEGDRHPAGLGSFPRAPDPAIAGGELPARDGGRCRRIGRRPLDPPVGAHLCRP